MISDFYKDKTRKDGLRSRCGTCERAQRVRYIKENSEKIRAQRALYTKENPKRVRAQKVFSKYGLTPEMEAVMTEEYNNCCWICETKFTEKGHSRRHIDHDHDIQERIGERFVRGMFCASCNTSLGKFGDNLAGVMKVVAYLKKAEERYRRSRLVLVKPHTETSELAPVRLDLTDVSKKRYDARDRF